MHRPTCVVILAAGEGTRMRSSRPKPLHHICGRPMVEYVLDAANLEDVKATVVVVGHEAIQVEKRLGRRTRGGQHLTFVEQAEQLGTGHAVSVSLATVDDAIGHSDGDVIILPGDTPLLRRATLERLVDAHRESLAAMTLLSAHADDPTGYGRVVHAKDGSVARIVEERDASPDERLITEVNTSIMVIRQSLLGPALRRVGRQNAQHEYYLTDVAGVLHEAGHRVDSVVLDDADEALGVNDRTQLAVAEAALRRRINDRWLARGVTMWDPAHTYVDADVEIGPEVSLWPGTILRGHCVLEAGCEVGPFATLTDTRVAKGARVASVEATEAEIGEGAVVEPYCVLSPGAVVAPGERVASFSRRP